MTRPLLALSLIMAFICPAWAQDNSSEYDQKATDRIIFGVGLYNVTDNQSRQRENMLRLEYRMASVPVWKMHPWFGFETASGQAEWFGAGLETDIDLYDEWLFLTIQTGVGYFDDGSIPYPWRRYNPDSGIEFRHQLELAVQFPEGNRIGVGFSHMSNAGLNGDGNPSMNAASINFHIPMNASGGRPTPVMGGND